MDKTKFQKLLKTIYESVDELEAMFPGRHFTPDGHLVGSLGEALAKFHYGIELYKNAATQCHDGSKGEKQIQIKTTQGTRISISSEPEHLLVLKLNRDGSFIEIFNGSGSLVWSEVSHKKLPKNGQYQVPLSTLSRLMEQVGPNEKI